MAQKQRQKPHPLAPTPEKRRLAKRLWGPVRVKQPRETVRRLREELALVRAQRDAALQQQLDRANLSATVDRVLTRLVEVDEMLRRVEQAALEIRQQLDQPPAPRTKRLRRHE